MGGGVGVVILLLSAFALCVLLASRFACASDMANYWYLLAVSERLSRLESPESGLVPNFSVKDDQQALIKRQEDAGHDANATG